LIEDLDEIEPGALWADANLGFDLGVRRLGALGDRHRLGWMTRATRLFAWHDPGEARVFETAALESAKEWVAR
jgi:SpoIIAA-like